MSEKFTHLNDDATPHMVDVGEKEATKREAVAQSSIKLPDSLMKELLDSSSNHKGPILQTCVLAGIQAVKKTSDIIPLCHFLPLSGIEIEPEIVESQNMLMFKVKVKTDGKTGVEMEALHGASACALTFYDMVKSSYRDLEIEKINLLEKKGGKSGHYQAKG
jgi:cyclic pyranopterin monophosphate synthase